MHSDKESNFDKISVLLLDVAGTTTSLEYIKDKLFAYVIEESPNFLKESAEDETVKAALKGLQEGDKELDAESAVEIIKKLTNEHSDHKSLKTLQGLISKAGYEKGKLKAHIFKDVKVAFESWAKDKTIAIYSTGDVDAQKLLFSNTIEGDLLSHVSKFFDQSIGIKTDPESYSKIIDELKVKSDEVIFISDNADELNAAKKSGLITALIKREGNAEVSEEISKEFTTTITSFTDLVFESSNKRKIDDTTDGSEIPPTKVPKTEEPKSEENKSELKTEEKSDDSCTANQQKQNGSVEKECEPMEVDSTNTEIKKAEEKEIVPTKDDITMDTDESKTVTDDAATTEPAKTEIENSTDKTEASLGNTDNVETDENKTEKTDETDRVANLNVINEKVTETNSNDGKKKLETEVKVNLDNAKSNEKTNDVASTPMEDVTESSITEKKVESCTENTDTISKDVDKTVDKTSALKNNEVESKVCNQSEENVECKITEISTQEKVETSNKEESVETKVEEIKEESVKENKEGKTEVVIEEKTEVAEEKKTEVVEEKKTEVVEEKKTEVVEEKKTEVVEEKTEIIEEKRKESKENERPVDNKEEKINETCEEKQEGISEKNEIKATEVVNEPNVKPQENGSTTENQNGSSTDENVPNGVVNGQDSCDTSSNGQTEDKSTDIKVKKIETNAGSPAVAVEV